jgi:hypothetical protein
MLLADIRTYLKQRKVASLEEVALHFDIASDSAKFALNYWVKRGKVSVLGAGCGSTCNACGTEANRYQWQEVEAIPIRWV